MKIKLNSIILAFILISLSACSGITENATGSGLGGTRFYSLSSLPPTNNNNSNLRIGVGPLEIPRLLNRPQIISRKDSTEIIMAEAHQWGGSYKEELMQALTDNLAALLKTDNIEQYPWKFSFKPQYQIRLDIERFDGELGKNITLKVRWRLFRNNQEILVKHAVINSAIKGNSFNDYVKAQSQTLIKLSQQIAAQIGKIK